MRFRVYKSWLWLIKPLILCLSSLFYECEHYHIDQIFSLSNSESLFSLIFNLTKSTGRFVTFSICFFPIYSVRKSFSPNELYSGIWPFNLVLFSIFINLSTFFLNFTTVKNFTFVLLLVLSFFSWGVYFILWVFLFHYFCLKWCWTCHFKVS